MNLNQVTLPSIDVQRSVNFYKVLGLKLIVHVPSRYARFICPDGDTTLSIHQVAALSDGEGITIYFEDDNMDDLVSNLKQKGIIFNSDPEDKNWLWREAHLRDPDGNRIIIFHAGENRINPPWRII